MSTLSHGIVGHVNTTASDPGPLLSTPEAGPVLLALSRGPNTAGGLAAACGVDPTAVASLMSNLERIGAVSAAGSQFCLTVPLWRAADGPALDAAVERVLPSLLVALERVWDELVGDLSSLRAADWVPIPELCTLVVGCFALDWGVIYGLAHRGQLSLGPQLADGSRFLLNLYQAGFEPESGLCSSRNQDLEGRLVTTFGSSAGYRLGFPDLMPQSSGWPLADHPVFTCYRRRYQALAEELGGDPATLAADRLEQLALGVGSTPCRGLDAFLEELGYTSGQRARIAVILPDESALVARPVRLVTETVAAWIPGVLETFGSLSPLAAGINSGVALMEIWHAVMGRANAELVERGLMAVPSPIHPGEGTYIKAVTCGFGQLQRQLLAAITGGA